MLAVVALYHQTVMKIEALKSFVTVQPFATGRLHLSNIFSSRERS